VSHHRKFRYIKRYNSRLVWLNLLALMCIALLPFPTAILGAYGNWREPVVFYAICVAVTGLAFWSVWWYALHHGLLRDNLGADIIRRGTRRSLTPVIFFVLSIPVALFVHPYAAEALWALSAIAVAL
jgi:uncharacterized membrane protein